MPVKVSRTAYPGTALTQFKHSHTVKPEGGIPLRRSQSFPDIPNGTLEKCHLLASALCLWEMEVGWGIQRDLGISQELGTEKEGGVGKKKGAMKKAKKEEEVRKK